MVEEQSEHQSLHLQIELRLCRQAANCVVSQPQEIDFHTRDSLCYELADDFFPRFSELRAVSVFE
jgi:hypothetical protein